MIISASYSKQQQIHALNFLSNAGFGMEAPNFAALQSYVSVLINTTLANTTIQGFLGSDWQMLWGPIVFSNKPDNAKVVADNTMMLLYSPSQKLVVVAIAGTNIDSVYGWLMEDFNVTTTIKWSDVVSNGIDVPSRAVISAGTHLGLQALLGMKDPSKDNKTMMEALTDFLAGADIPGDLEIAVTGHSLGGALAPTLALYLKDMERAVDNWNRNKKVSSITGWPTAGPTPGDVTFSEYLASTLDKYDAKYNSIDAIPHGWMSTSLAEVPTLYTPHIPLSPVVVMLALSMEHRSLKIFPKLYWQARPWNKMEGTFNEATDQACIAYIAELEQKYPSFAKVIGELTHTIRFIGQMGYQHTTAYSAPAILNIEDYSAEYKQIKEHLNPDGVTMEDIHKNALESAIERYLGIEPFSNPPAGSAATA